MRHFYIALAAVAALVGCSVEGDYNINIEGRDEFNLVAGIDDAETRVAIAGEKYNEVSWVAGDNIVIRSEAGAAATLTAQSSGKTNVNFKGTGTTMAEYDTYYGIYARSGSYSLNGSRVTLNCAEQWGGAASTATVLVGMAEEVQAGAIDMSFKPANALLRVNITNGPGALTKAVFKALDGTAFATSYTYDIASGSVAHTATASEIVVNSPSADGFFVSLPADLDMGNYVLTITDGNGNVCTKAYAAKTFAKGTTTRVAFDWTTPTVKLGAKSSYTYYSEYNDVASANNDAFIADPAKVFFTTGLNGESCASTYSGVQDAVIEDLGYEIDGVDYTHSAGQVSWDKAGNSFVLNAEPSYNKDWGRKTGIKAYVKVGGVKVYSTNTVWITGLPYKANWFNSDAREGWATTGTVDFHSEYGFCTLYYYLGGTTTGEIYSPSFVFPSNTNIHYDIKACYYTGGVGSAKIDLITGITSGTNKPSSTQTKTLSRVTSNMIPEENQYTLCQFDATMGNGQRVYITDDHQKDGNLAQNWFSIGSCVITYRSK